MVQITDFFLKKVAKAGKSSIVMFAKTNGYKELPAMTAEIISIWTAFSSEFTRPTWKNIQTLFIGAILCRGARRITSILRVMDLCNERNFSKYHRVLSRAAWNDWEASAGRDGVENGCIRS
jgi:hypothetical protein